MSSSALGYALLIILLAALTTVLLRAFPFIAFGRSKETPPLIRYLGSVISPAAIAMLTIYCLCSHWQSGLHLWGGAEIIAGTVVVIRALSPTTGIFCSTARSTICSGGTSRPKSITSNP